SFQKHYHRSEHWIIVKGTATVTIGDETRLLTENQSVYIPIGQPHRLANEGQIPLELVEIQTGAYLGEDDVIRIEDDYKRH
ncbi:cupin domain-containing protein, partial [Agrobacterium tumefaciens]|nr:cupin domain-containing protein [Agrobacterium tumefaciens]